MNSNRLFWGVVFILLGLVLVLNNLGLLGGINVWELIGPVFLIALGVWIVVRPMLRLKSVEKVSVTLENAQAAALHIEHGAGRLAVHGGAAPGMLLEGSCGGGVEVKTNRTGNLLDARVKVPTASFPMIGIGTYGLDWDLAVNGDVLLNLDVQGGASENRLDLSKLRVVDLRLQTGASATYLTMPEAAGMTRARISTGAASLELRIPEGVAARITSRGGLATIAVDTQRFPRREGFYQSDDYDSAANKLELDVETGLGSVNIR